MASHPFPLVRLLLKILEKTGYILPQLLLDSIQSDIVGEYFYRLFRVKDEAFLETQDYHQD